VKPLMKDLDVFELKEDSENPLKLAWQAVLAGIVKIFKNQPKDQFATKIPVSGTIDKKGIALWATIGNVLRNAFVRAFSPTFDQTVGPSKDLTEDPKIQKEKEKDEKKAKEGESIGGPEKPLRRDMASPT
jgi:hypothetical protein